MVIVIFSLFYSALYFFTQGFNKMFNIFQDQPNQEYRDLDTFVSLKVFYPIIGIFYIGNIIFMLNFISGIKRISTLLFVVIFAVVAYGVYQTNFQRNKLHLLMNLIVPAVIGISSYGIGIHYDAGLYSIPNQAWIRESSIVFGLTNINPWLSWTSLFEYFSTILWFNESFTLLHFLDNSFIVTFFIFIFFGLTSSNIFYQSTSFLLILFSLLDNVGYLGGANGFPMIEKIIKPNNSLGILVFLVLFLIILCTKKNIYSFRSLQLLALLALFAYQLNGIGVILVLPSIIYFLNFLNVTGESTLTIFKKIFYYFIILFFWLTKNIINSACLAFPVMRSCIKSLSWFNYDLTNDIETAAFSRGYSYNFNEPFLDYFSRAISYSNTKQILINFILTLTILYVMNKILYRQKYNKKNYVAFSLFYIVGVIFWLRVGALPRYGMYLFILASIFITINNVELRGAFFSKSVLYIFFFIALTLTPRIYSYNNFFEYNGMFYYSYIPNVKYEKIKDDWGVYPINEDLAGQIGSDRCYSNINCRPKPVGEYTGSKNLSKNYFLGHTLFVVKNEK